MPLRSRRRAPDGSCSSGGVLCSDETLPFEAQTEIHLYGRLLGDVFGGGASRGADQRLEFQRKLKRHDATGDNIVHDR